MKTTRWTLPITLLLLAAACKESDPNVETQTDPTPDSTTDEGTSAGPTTGDTTDEPTTVPTTGDPPGDVTTESTVDPTTDGSTTVVDPTGDPCEALQISPIDETACEILASDYTPRENMSKDDEWDPCITDNGVYAQIEAKVPGSVARVVQYETVADLLWRDGVVPDAAAFTAARDAYITPEGLESRLVRREDLHYPAIPMAEWDPQVDSDKQCTIEALWKKYPERCIGPSTMAPAIEAAFVAGQTGDGDPAVHAAKIHAMLDWFLYLSVYKEAETCASVKAADCDSAWAYYTGGESIDKGIGIAGDLRVASQNTHERIHDGILAVRCWRDHQQDMGMYPLLPEIDADGLAEFEKGWEQLDQALHRGFALLVRAQLVNYLEGSCLEGAPNLPAIWAYLQVAGPALEREATERDAAQAAVLATLWDSAAPTVPELEAGLAALDAIFPCP
jgi:hypothetical protein